MEPIPETAEVLDQLAEEGARSLRERLVALAERAQAIVPDLVGVTLARREEGLTLTLTATAAEVAVLDAVQYVAGGPCVDAAVGQRTDDYTEYAEGDVLDEERWRTFAEATAARAVRSTLTLPIQADDRVVGTVNLYGASPQAFGGHHEELAGVFSAWARGAVTNADLPFRTRRDAVGTAQRLREATLVEQAAAVLAVRLGLGHAEAVERLHRSAELAGIEAADLARLVLESDDDL